jgi:hypothetical protein
MLTLKALRYGLFDSKRVENTPSGLIYKQKSTKTFGLKYKQKLPKPSLFNAILPKVPSLFVLLFKMIV